MLIVKKALEAIYNALKPVIDAFNTVGGALGGIVKALFGSPQTIFEDAADGVRKLQKEMGKLKPTSWNSMVIPKGGLGFTGAAGGVNVNISGPLVNVEGSVDRATAEYAAELVKEKLQSVIIENTSSNAITKRIRVKEE